LGVGALAFGVRALAFGVGALATRREKHAVRPRPAEPARVHAFELALPFHEAEPEGAEQREAMGDVEIAPQLEAGERLPLQVARRIPDDVVGHAHPRIPTAALAQLVALPIRDD